MTYSKKLEDKLVIVSISFIGLFSIGSFVYHIITADKFMGFLSVISFAIIIIIGILLPHYDKFEYNYDGGEKNGK
jgi:hypothetical protein